MGLGRGSPVRQKSQVTSVAVYYAVHVHTGVSNLRREPSLRPLPHWDRLTRWLPLVAPVLIEASLSCCRPGPT